MALGVMTAAGVFDAAQHIAVDVFFNARGPLPIDEELITVDIDDPALSFAGRWPWPMNIHSRIIDFLTTYGARSVSFVDMDFSRKPQLSLPENERAILKERLMKGLSQGDTDSLSTLHGILTGGDEVFYDGIKKNGRVFFTIGLKMPRAGATQFSAFADTEARGALQRRASLGKAAEKSSLYRPVDVLPPMNDILENARGTGLNAIFLDIDGTVRKYPLVYNYAGDLYPSLGLTLSANLLEMQVERISPGRFIELGKDKKKLRIPVDEHGSMYVNWAGDYHGTFVHVPFTMVSYLAGLQSAKEEFRKYGRDDLLNKSDWVIDRVTAALKDTRLLPNDKATLFVDIVFRGILMEDFIVRMKHDLKDALIMAGQSPGDPDYKLWYEIGSRIIFANYLVDEYAFTGKLPQFKAALDDAGVIPAAADLPRYQAAYDTVSYHLKNGTVDKVRPLVFENATLKAGRREFNINPAFFQGKTVFYGLTATGLTAQHPSPFLKRHPMSDLLPNVVNTVLTGSFLTDAPWWHNYVGVFLYVFIILFCGMLLNPVWSGALALLAAFLHVLTAWLLFVHAGLIIPVPGPIAAIAGAYVSAVIYRYVQERKERRRVLNMFSTMVSPEVLKIMEKNPEKFAISGEKRKATMFSSDVSGFTTISEGVTSRELAEILNLYLTPMSNIIMSYDGYVDKYEGDAIKADFGVPVADAGHALKASLAALYQQEELKIIQRMLLLKYGVAVTARMGVNTGVVSAGNMGSEKRMQYTVMGDAAAIAEELEPANKLFETWIMIGDVTFEQAAESVETRYLNDLILGGGHRMAVYELLGARRDKFLDYWLGKPIPALMLENIHKMSPEKVLAYHHYLERKGLPPSEFLKEFMALMTELKGLAMDFMEISNTRTVLFARTELERFIGWMEMHESVYLNKPMPEASLLEIQRVTTEFPNEKRQGNLELIRWRIRLRRYTGLLPLLNGAVEKDEYENLLTLGDIVTKKMESMIKRMNLSRAGDETAATLAKSLIKLVLDEDKGLLSNDDEKLAYQNALIEKTINARLATFVDGFKTRPEDFYRFIADFCVVSDDKRRAAALYAQGLEHYFKRRWDEATGKFDEALAVCPTDGPSLKMKKKVEELKKTPPGEEWNGWWEA
jgi:class 3 adenylate cyclase